MTSNKSGLGGWRSFAATLTTAVDLAIERHRQEQEAAAAPVSALDDGATVFRFRLLAGATAVDEPPLPSKDAPLVDGDQSMKFWVEKSEDGESLLVRLRPLDIETADDLAGRWATVTLGRGLLSLSLRFDHNGDAAFDLPNHADTRAALCSAFQIDVPGERFAFRPDGDGGEE